MALELHIAGPGLDVRRTLAAGDEPIVLGRDPECDVCLPDPERTVSRRHLSLWVVGDELHFHVLSVVNGIEMPFGEAPPGARGVLPAGQMLRVGDYAVSAEVVQVDAGQQQSRPGDPWAALDREQSGIAPVPKPVAGDEDPFGDWGFETTFGPQGAAGPLDAKSLQRGEVSAFFRGLGLPADAAMTEGELEAAGRLVRALVLGLLDLHRSVAGVKEELRSEDRTMVAPRETNPLKSNWPHEAKLRYLFAGRIAPGGMPVPEHAVRDLLLELVAHNSASGAAARATVEAILMEFAPGTLKTRLLGGGPKLFEGARAWDAYCKFHEEQSADLGQWSQRLLERHFTEAYVRESVRIRRETPKR